MLISDGILLVEDSNLERYFYVRNIICTHAIPMD